MRGGGRGRALRDNTYACYVYVEKGLTALCHRGISGVGVQTLLCPVPRSLYTRVRDFFFSPDVWDSECAFE